MAISTRALSTAFAPRLCTGACTRQEGCRCSHSTEQGCAGKGGRGVPLRSLPSAQWPQLWYQTPGTCSVCTRRRSFCVRCSAATSQHENHCGHSPPARTRHEATPGRPDFCQSQLPYNTVVREAQRAHATAAPRVPLEGDDHVQNDILGPNVR